MELFQEQIEDLLCPYDVLPFDQFRRRVTVAPGNKEAVAWDPFSRSFTFGCFFELETAKKRKLVKDDQKIDGTEGNDDSFHRSVFAVHAQEDCAEGDNTKLPNPEIRPIEVHDRTDDGLTSRPFRSRIIMVKSESRMFSPKIRTRKKKIVELWRSI